MAVRCPSCARMVPPETDICPRCGSSLFVPLRLGWLAQLFWACPGCQVETPLTVRHPLFGEACLECRACGSSWRFDPAARTLAHRDRRGGEATAPEPVANWVARLPSPLTWRALPAQRLLLLPRERCLVRVDGARLLAPRQSVQRQQPIGRVEIGPGVFERIAPDPLGPSPRRLPTQAHGPFFVTDRRIVFLGDRKHVEVPLPRLDAAEVDEGFLLLHRAARTDTFGFAGESAVKVRAAILTVAALDTDSAGRPVLPTQARDSADAGAGHGTNGAASRGNGVAVDLASAVDDQAPVENV
ncbi:MAG: hypothetical protein AVDCRST_MAG88-1471 [uncultured Thermomicrobiales bacterium]|uniref:Uncharacterized protein n=1 Tax=uncultured Thermomicrobiales bacterium TaxID=1645740 RepID=A0A6J4UWJ3_9BACT|nr:MAG: hypothetical protein AVDCRST_MAG88-1471 [uncultured Thermomicrobiales bacterium]